MQIAGIERYKPWFSYLEFKTGFQYSKIKRNLNFKYFYSIKEFNL